MSEEHAKAFERDGYVHVKGAIDPEALRSFREFILRELDRHQSRLLNDSAAIYPQMQQFLRRPRRNSGSCDRDRSAANSGACPVAWVPSGPPDR